MSFSFVIENFLYALRGLQQHRLRSFLTMLGVIFGVAAVIAMLSIGKGAEQEAIEQIAAFGINNVRVYAKDLNQETHEKAQRTPSVGLSYEDALYIKKVLPYITGAAPQNLIEKDVYYQQLNPEVNLVGTTPDYLSINGFQLEKGRFLTQDDLTQNRKVCVLSGSPCARAVFKRRTIRPVDHDWGNAFSGGWVFARPRQNQRTGEY